MRLLLASDLHYTLPQLDWVVHAAAGCELVALAGDCLDIAAPVPLDVQSVVLLRYFALMRQAAPLAVSSGNHDLTGPDAAGEQAALWLPAARAAGVAIDGDTLELGSTRVSVFPWWDGPRGRAAVEARMQAEAATRPAR